MFARAGISGRNLRRGTQASVLYTPPRRRRPKKKFRCYVPFMGSTCVAVLVGFFILLGGTGMCAVGYYADFFSSEQFSNETHIWTERTDHNQYRNIRAMAYLGPICMGVGCFVIVVACVVICETRDKMIKIMEEQEKERRAKEARVIKPNFYDLIIGQVRRDRVTTTVDDKEKKRQKLKEFLMRPGSAKSVQSEYTCIRRALQKIPAGIFTIDMDGKGGTSMAPIHMAKPHTLPIGENQVTTKYPSASCLHDLLTMEDEQLDKLFPSSMEWLSSSPTSPTKITTELDKSPLASPSPSQSPTEKRPKIYDDDAGSVFSLNAEEHTTELENRLPINGERPRPKSSMSRPRTAGAIPSRVSPNSRPGSRMGDQAPCSPSRPSSQKSKPRSSSPAKGMRASSRCEFSDESDIDIPIDRSDSELDFNEKDDRLIRLSSDTEDERQSPARKSQSSRRRRSLGGKSNGEVDRFGATCDTKDTYEPLGQNGLHGDANKEGVARATTPGPAEKEAYNNSNIIVHAAIHREPALTVNDAESVLSQPFVGDGEGRFSSTREPRRSASRATTVVSPSHSSTREPRRSASRATTVVSPIHSSTRVPRGSASRATTVVSPIHSELEDDEDGDSLDSISLPDECNNFGESRATVTPGKVFQQNKSARQTDDKAGDNLQTRPRTGIPGTNKVKVPTLYREPNPRPKTSFMRPSEPNTAFPNKKKPARSFAYSRNGPKLTGNALASGSIGMRPIRTNTNNNSISQPNSMKARPKTASLNMKSNSVHSSATEDRS